MLINFGFVFYGAFDKNQIEMYFWSSVIASPAWLIYGSPWKINIVLGPCNNFFNCCLLQTTARIKLHFRQANCSLELLCLRK